MNEKEWAASVLEAIAKYFSEYHPALSIRQGSQLPYASEILLYDGKKAIEHNEPSYETDLLVVENISARQWKPRVVIEVKFASITTHDAITYSEKAFTHKRVHPYLRYGILLGDRKHYPLPGRLFRHGLYFDFMLSWAGEIGTSQEFNDLTEIILAEVEASRSLEEILYNSRSASRNKYSVLHRPLVLR